MDVTIYTVNKSFKYLNLWILCSYSYGIFIHIYLCCGGKDIKSTYWYD